MAHANDLSYHEALGHIIESNRGTVDAAIRIAQEYWTDRIKDMVPVGATEDALLALCKDQLGEHTRLARLLELLDESYYTEGAVEV